jgi:hypothetical protein
MAIAVVQEFEGGRLQQYDAVMSRMGFSKEGSGPPGSLFHWVAKTDTGTVITDVWQDRETFEKFAQEKIGPLSAEVGVERPKITYYEVHNYLTAG